MGKSSIEGDPDKFGRVFHCTLQIMLAGDVLFEGALQTVRSVNQGSPESTIPAGIASGLSALAIVLAVRNVARRS